MKLKTVAALITFATMVSVGSRPPTVLAGDNYSIKKSDDTPHAPATPPQTPQRKVEPETKTILAPTWPVQVPVRVPKNMEEPRDNPHAGENPGTNELIPRR